MSCQSICTVWHSVQHCLFSDLSNRLENKTNYTQNVCSHAQCIILFSMSGFLYSTASFDIWNCGARTM